MSPAWCAPQRQPRVDGQQTLILHWNGTAWSRVPSPNPPAGYLNALFGVVAICPHNAWAVGTTNYANT